MTHMPVTEYVKWAILADVQSAIITCADIRQNRQTIRLVKMPNKSSCNADVRHTPDCAGWLASQRLKTMQHLSRSLELQPITQALYCHLHSFCDQAYKVKKLPFSAELLQ